MDKGAHFRRTDLQVHTPRDNQWNGAGHTADADREAYADRFVAAAEKMNHDGWWWRDATLTNKVIRRQILKEMLTRKRPR